MSDQGHYSEGWSPWTLTDDRSRYFRMRLDENGSYQYEFDPPATGPTVPRGDNVNDLGNAFSNVSINDSYQYQTYSEGQYGYSHGQDSGAGTGSANPYTAPPSQLSQHRLSSKEKSKAANPTAKSKKHPSSKAPSSKKQNHLKGSEMPVEPFGYLPDTGGATSADQVYSPSEDTLPREYSQRTDGDPGQESEGVDGGVDEQRAFSQFEPYYDAEQYYTQEEPEQHPSRQSKGKHPKPSKGKQKQHTGYSETATNTSEWTSTAGGSSSKYYDHASAEARLEGAGDAGDQTPRAYSPANPSQDPAYPPQDSYLPPQEPHYSEEQYHDQDHYQYQSTYKTQHGPSTSQATTRSVYSGYVDNVIESAHPQDAITASSQYPGQSEEVILADVELPFNSELDHRYTIEQSSRFAPGEVFKILWSEPKGGKTEEVEVSEYREQNFMGKIFYFGFRRFIVVANDEGHCTCVPILTYERRACNKKGVKPQKHGIIYPSYGRPQTLPREPELGFDPVKLHLDYATEKLAKESRVNYSKLVTVEHNVRVFFIGRIVAEDFDIVAEAVDKCWLDKRRGGKGGESSHHRRRHGR